MLMYPSSSSCLYAAVCAVISVNIVIAMYVYVAWNSADPDTHSCTPAAAAAAADKMDWLSSVMMIE